jgi:hypothetical protein
MYTVDVYGRCIRYTSSVRYTSSPYRKTLLLLHWSLQELYSHYSQQVKDTLLSLSDPHKAYLLRKAVHYFNTRLLYRQGIDNYPTNKPIIQVCAA